MITIGRIELILVYARINLLFIGGFMAYQLFDLTDKEVTNSDLQNRSIWYQHGVRKEDVFVDRYRTQFDVSINPEKSRNPAALDLIHSGHLADLKCQNTPFFFAFKFGIDPTFAVTFNLKDAFNYGKWGRNYEKLVIFYWVDWVAVKMISNGKSYSVTPLTGIWKIEYSRLEEMRQLCPIHWYNQRNRRYETNPVMQKALSGFEPRLKDIGNIWSIRETGINAACSYVFDLRNFGRLE
jgi:hypothetical protein